MLLRRRLLAWRHHAQEVWIPMAQPLWVMVAARNTQSLREVTSQWWP